MAQFLKQSTAATILVGPALDKDDGVTPETGLTAGAVDEIVVYKHDATSATDISGTTTLTHRAGGNYTATLSASDTGTLGRLTTFVRDDDVCLPIWKEFMVVPANVYDSLFGADALQVHANEITAGLITAAAIATGAIDADAIAGDAITAAKIAAGAIGAAELADAAIDAATLAADMDTYQAKLWLFDDDSGANDRYVAVWFQNGEPVTSGITSPQIQVIKVADGTDLVGATAMTQIGALGMYRYDEGTNRIVSGAAYIAKVTATIGGSGRTWYQPVGRDS